MVFSSFFILVFCWFFFSWPFWRPPWQHAPGAARPLRPSLGTPLSKRPLWVCSARTRAACARALRLWCGNRESPTTRVPGQRESGMTLWPSSIPSSWLMYSLLPEQRWRTKTEQVLPDQLPQGDLVNYRKVIALQGAMTNIQ